MRGTFLGLALAGALFGHASAGEPAQHEPLGSGSWTGCYVGARLAGLWGNESWTNETPGGAYFGQSLGSHSVSGALGGGQIGCDYQFASGIVLGLQGDYVWASLGGRHPSLHETGVTYGSDVRSLATVTGRVGQAWGQLLGYVKGGAAWEHDRNWASTTMIGLAYEGEPTRTGWTLGVGAEYAITPQLSAFVEYDYVDFGGNAVRLTPLVAGLPPGLVSLQESRSVLSGGINLRFGQ